MPATPFSAEARSVPDRDAAAIVLHGDIDGAAESGLNAAYGGAVDADAHIVVLDFRDVPFMNSTGIALIVQLLARARDEGRSLRAVGLSPHYREIFEITRLTDFIPIFSDETAALATAANT